MEKPAGRDARVAVGVAGLLMVVAALENTAAPWAPFYVVYATLASGLPLLLGRDLIGRGSIPRARFWLAAVALAFVLQGVARLMVGAADLPGMFGAVFDVAGAHLKRSPGSVAKAYLLLILIWAGFGEELFYRWYLQTRLKRRFGSVVGITAASTLYAVRHYTQVLLVWPLVPWGHATIWVAATFVVGLGLGTLYEKSGSLLPPILCHYLFNLLG